MEDLKYFVESSIIAEATTIAVCIYKGESEWKYFYVLSVNEVSLYDNWRTQPGALEICRHDEARAVASKQNQTKFANVIFDVNPPTKLLNPVCDFHDSLWLQIFIPTGWAMASDPAWAFKIITLPELVDIYLASWIQANIKKNY